MNCMNISHLARNHSRASLLAYRLYLSRPYSGQNETRWTSFRRIRLPSRSPQAFQEAEDVNTGWTKESTFDPTNFLDKGASLPRTGVEPQSPKPGGPTPFMWAQSTWRPVRLKRVIPDGKGESKSASAPIYAREIQGPMIPQTGNRNLHWVVDPWNKVEAKRALEAGGIDINSRNYSGMTPLHLVAQQNLPGAVEVLMRYGADVTIKDNQGFTPLHLAVLCKAKDAVPALLAAGSDPETQNAVGETPLHTAIRKNSEEIVKRLIAGGAVINPPKGTKTPPVHLAARLRRKVILSLLIKSKAKLDLRDELGRTPLHYTAERDEYRAMYMLLSKRVPIDAMDNEGNTPLHLSLKNDGKRTTAMLIQMGADCSKPSPEGGVMDPRLVKVASEMLVRFRGVPGMGMGKKYHGPYPAPKPPKVVKQAVMGVGDDWADRMLEESEQKRLRKKELREAWMEKDEELKQKWKSPFVFNEDRPRTQ